MLRTTKEQNTHLNTQFLRYAATFYKVDFPQEMTPNAPRRILLDHILANAAVEAGVELRAGFQVQELLRQGERVTGIHGPYVQGEAVTEKARLGATWPP
jgi:flavin-dependent dehydrogenase